MFQYLKAVHTRACLKKAFCKMCVTICGRFRSDEGRRSGLRQPNSGEIYRKVGRADCGNDFSNTLYPRSVTAIALDFQNNRNFRRYLMIPITGHTQLTALLGSPVAHSISPLMHNEAFHLLDLDYTYLCFNVNEENLETAVMGLKTCGIRGFNLTMPNKNKIVELLDELSPLPD